QTKTGLGISAFAKLRDAQLDVLVPHALRVSNEPASEGMPGNRNFTAHEFVQARSSDLYASHEHNLRHVDQPASGEGLVFDHHLLRVALFGELRPKLLYVQGQGSVATDCQPAGNSGGFSEEVDFIGQANGYQPASWAFRAVFQRRR